MEKENQGSSNPENYFLASMPCKWVCSSTFCKSASVIWSSLLGILYLIFALIFYIDLAIIFRAVSAYHKKTSLVGMGDALLFGNYMKNLDFIAEILY